MALSASLQTKVDKWLGSGQSLASDADRIDFVLEVTPVKLSTSTPETLYFSVGGYRKVTSHKKSPARFVAPQLSTSLLNDSFGTIREDGSVELAQFSPGELQIGTLELINTDGDLDSVATGYGWGDADAEVKIGRKGDDYTDFETLYAFKVREEPRYDLDRITLEAKPALVSWNAPAVTTLLAGDATQWEGPADLADTTAPFLLGVRRYILAQLTQWSSLSYLISDVGLGALNSIQDVYQAGHEGALYTAQLANGGFTLTYTPDTGPITVYAEGVKFDAGAYSAQQGKVIQEWLQLSNASTTINATDLAAHTDTVGIYVAAGDRVTIREGVEQLVRPLSLLYPAEDASEWHLKTITAPPGSPIATYTKGDIENGGEALKVAPASPPVWRVRVSYQGLDAPPDVIQSEDATVQAFLSAPHRFKEASDSAILTDYPNALDLVILTNLDSGTHAQTAATNALALFKVPRHRYTIPLSTKWGRAYLMEEFSLEYDRYGLDSGKDLWTVGIETSLGRRGDNAVASYTVTGWG